MLHAFLSILLASSVYGSLLSKQPALCAARYAGALPYTGFRIYRRYSFGWPSLQHYLFIHCSYGRMDYSQYFLTSRNMNFNWNEQLCFDQDWCFRAVRRKKYAQRKLPVYVTNRVIGGLFKCNSPDCITSTVPILPLLADSPAKTISLRESTRRVRYVPFASTPDLLSLQYPRVVSMDGIPNWARELDITENYEYTSSDKARPWFMANRVLNKMYDKLQIDGSYYPWEFDYASRELGRD